MSPRTPYAPCPAASPWCSSARVRHRRLQAPPADACGGRRPWRSALPPRAWSPSRPAAIFPRWRLRPAGSSGESVRRIVRSCHEPSTIPVRSRGRHLSWWRTAPWRASASRDPFPRRCPSPRDRHSVRPSTCPVNGPWRFPHAQQWRCCRHPALHRAHSPPDSATPFRDGWRRHEQDWAWAESGSRSAPTVPAISAADRSCRARELAHRPAWDRDPDAARTPACAGSARRRAARPASHWKSASRSAHRPATACWQAQGWREWPSADCWNRARCRRSTVRWHPSSANGPAPRAPAPEPFASPCVR